MEGQVKIRRGLPARLEQHAAELYWEAFDRKLGRALGPRDKGVEFLATQIDPTKALVAEQDGRLAGLIGYGTDFLRCPVSEVIRTYGWLTTPHRLALLALLESREMPDELYVDGIAVDAACRGQGVGTLLLDELDRLAAGLGRRYIRLQVVDTNPRAQALYERCGFTTLKIERTPYLRKLMGFGAVTTMRKEVR